MVPAAEIAHTETTLTPKVEQELIFALECFQEEMRRRGTDPLDMTTEQYRLMHTVPRYDGSFAETHPKKEDPTILSSDEQEELPRRIDQAFSERTA
jgi:hypothetical protein